MMAREWKPADVALIRVGRYGRTHVALRDSSREWLIGDSPAWRRLPDDTDPAVTVLRPLLVLDADDREQIERLRDLTLQALRDQIGYRATRDEAFTECDLGNAMQAAVRSLLDPKPLEPTDPKAYVDDRRGNVWRLLADGDWVCTSGPDHGEYITWARLTERGPLTINGVTR